MKEQRLLHLSMRVLLIVALALGSTRAGAQGVSLDDSGITFPDGTTQVTAAAGSPEARYYSCLPITTGDIFDFLSPNETREFRCSSTSEIGISFFSSVPAGMFFVATDVLIGNPDGTTETGKTNIRLRALLDDCDTGTGSIYNDTTLYFRTTQNLETRVFSGISPLFMMPAGACLSAFAYSTNSTEVDLRVNGYLTDDPTYFHPAR